MTKTGKLAKLVPSNLGK